MEGSGGGGTAVRDWEVGGIRGWRDGGQRLGGRRDQGVEEQGEAGGMRGWRDREIWGGRRGGEIGR